MNGTTHHSHSPFSIPLFTIRYSRFAIHNHQEAPPPPPLEELQKQIVALQAQVTQLQSQLATAVSNVEAAQALSSNLAAQLAALRAKVTQAITILQGP